VGCGPFEGGTAIRPSGRRQARWRSASRSPCWRTRRCSRPGPPSLRSVGSRQLSAETLGPPPHVRGGIAVRILAALAITTGAALGTLVPGVATAQAVHGVVI